MSDPRDLIQRLTNALHEQTCLYEGYEDPLVAEARAYLAAHPKQVAIKATGTNIPTP